MYESDRPGLRQISLRVALALAVGAGMVGKSALAQPSVARDANSPSRNVGDPPARVGRVARISGTVSFHGVDVDQWQPATLNYPVTSGNAFWTPPGGSADIDLGGARVRLSQSSEFDVDVLDDQRIAATVLQGHIALDLRALPQGESVTLRTPRGTVSLLQAGRYAVVVGDTEHSTVVTVAEGAADIEGPGVSLQLSAHQAGELRGIGPFSGTVVAESPDALVSALMALDRPLAAQSTPRPPSVVSAMTGYDAIAETGLWEPTSDYGRVWYPPVEPGWVPYRQGRWSWVSPWGWTWLDDAPWGFAPSHYGRWVEINDRWAWTPEDRGAPYVGRPVYAPALVSFVGAGVGVAAGVGLASAVGWIPLGPHEVYRPPYHVSEGYARRVNSGNITINNGQRTGNYFVNTRATTVVPATAMQQSLPVAGHTLPTAQTQRFGLRPVLQPQVQPNIPARGVTPVAPGPSFRSHDTGAQRAPGTTFSAVASGISRVPSAIGVIPPGIRPVVGRPNQNTPSLNTAPAPAPIPAPTLAPRMPAVAADEAHSETTPQQRRLPGGAPLMAVPAGPAQALFGSPQGAAQLGAAPHIRPITRSEIRPAPATVGQVLPPRPTLQAPALVQPPLVQRAQVPPPAGRGSPVPVSRPPQAALPPQPQLRPQPMQQLRPQPVPEVALRQSPSPWPTPAPRPAPAVRVAPGKSCPPNRPSC